MPKVGEPTRLQSVNFSCTMYGFIGVNTAQWPQGTNYPELVVKYLDVESICTSPAGVEQYITRSCYKKRDRPEGFVARLDVAVAQIVK